MTSYIDAGSIVAGAAGMTMWQGYLDMSQQQVGLLNSCSANALSAAVGALIGGRICDLLGRKLVYTYDLLFYILGMLIIIFSFSYPMLLIGFAIVGFSVGADVSASWTLIAENAPAENRARHCGTAQLMWALGPAVVLLLSAVLSFYLSDPVKDKELDGMTSQVNTMKLTQKHLQKTEKTVLGLEKNLQGQLEKAKKAEEAPDPVVAALFPQVQTQLAQLKTQQNQLQESLDKIEPGQKALAYELAAKYLPGNKLVFAHLAIIAFIVWIMRLRMPESEEWVSNKEKEKELIEAGVWQKTSYWDLFTNPQNLRGLMLLIGIYMVWNLAAGTMGGLLPYMYERAGGVTTGMSQALTALLFVTSCFATLFIFMRLADKYSQRMIYCVIACLFIVAWGIFFLPKAMLGIPMFIVVAVLMGTNNGSGQQAFYQMWGAEMFPARYRAAAQGLSFFTARFCLSIWLFLVPVIMGLDGSGMPTVALILVGCATISMLIGTIFCPKTAGKTLQQIEEERYGKVEKK